MKCRNRTRNRKTSRQETPVAALRDASELLWPAVAETLSQLDLGPEDAGIKKLAQRYSQVIDQHADPAWCARWVFPLLLDCLEQLGATPAARARLKTGKQADAPVSQLAKLRAARRT
jgi:hypothetical protein